MKLTQAGPIRLHHSTEGLGVVADLRPQPFVGAFKVSLAGAVAVRVGLGIVEGLTPTLQGVPLSGLDEEGSVVRVPNLDCSQGPNDELRSWVFLGVRVDLATGRLLDAEHEDAGEVAVIEHGNNLGERYQRGFSRDDGSGRGWLPLAMLIWRDESTLMRVVQNTYFNQTHVFREAKDGVPAFHQFFPAAL
jgi:hypothetical protein